MISLSFSLVDIFVFFFVFSFQIKKSIICFFLFSLAFVLFFGSFDNYYFLLLFFFQILFFLIHICVDIYKFYIQREREREREKKKRERKSDKTIKSRVEKLLLLLLYVSFKSVYKHLFVNEIN